MVAVGLRSKLKRSKDLGPPRSGPGRVRYTAVTQPYNEVRLRCRLSSPSLGRLDAGGRSPSRLGGRTQRCHMSRRATYLTALVLSSPPRPAYTARPVSCVREFRCPLGLALPSVLCAPLLPPLPPPPTLDSAHRTAPHGSARAAARPYVAALWARGASALTSG